MKNQHQLQQQQTYNQNQNLNVTLYSFYFDGLKKTTNSNGTWTALPKKSELINKNLNKKKQTKFI